MYFLIETFFRFFVFQLFQVHSEIKFEIRTVLILKILLVSTIVDLGSAVSNLSELLLGFSFGRFPSHLNTFVKSNNVLMLKFSANRSLSFKLQKLSGSQLFGVDDFSRIFLTVSFLRSIQWNVWIFIFQAKFAARLTWKWLDLPILFSYTFWNWIIIFLQV